MTEEIRNVYTAMYDAMIRKDTETLEKVLADDFVLVHMTGMRQDKQAFINAVRNGTLNYYSAVHEDLPVTAGENEALLNGHSYVLAAVFGGGKHYWHLEQRCRLRKTENGWQIYLSEAGTY